MRAAALLLALSAALAAPSSIRAQPAAPAAASAATPASGPGSSIRDQLSPEADRRLRKLEEELRCLVCQNQSLADSGADLAVDLRRQVETMVAEGRSDGEIKDYLVERYGDFVLYRPPVQRNTLALWLGPFLLLALGLVVWIVVQRRSTRVTTLRPDTPAADRERARRLLDE